MFVVCPVCGDAIQAGGLQDILHQDCKNCGASLAPQGSRPDSFKLEFGDVDTQQQQGGGGQQQQQQGSSPSEALSQMLANGAPIYPYTQGNNTVDGEQEQKDDPKKKEYKKIKDDVFYQRLRSIMKDNAFDRIIPKRKKGKLDMKRLWRAQAGYENVFKQKQERQGKHYHVTLAIDMSGSMRYDQSGHHGRVELPDGTVKHKTEIATEAALFMANSLERVGIDFSLIGFGDDFERKQKTYPLIKPFNKKMRKLNQTELSEFIFDNTGNGTPMYSALEYGFKELKNNATHKKIMIVFTDGMENGMLYDSKAKDGRLYDHRDYNIVCSKCKESARGCWNYGCHTFQMDEFPSKHLIKANSDVLTLGVGIDADFHLEQVFDHSINISELQEFKPKALEMLQKHIKRG